MKRRPHRIFGPEYLEDRWVPATVRLTGSYLMISSQVGDLTITQTAQNQFKVQDGPSTLTYSRIGNIYVTGTNANNKITLNLGAFNYTGSLLVNSGNGNDTITITSTGTASLQGNTTILTGYGNDTVELNSTGTQSVRFGGSVQVTNTLGNTTVNFGNAAATSSIGSNLTIFGCPTVNLGKNLQDTIGGNLSITNSTLNVPTNLTVTDLFTVDKDVTVTTGSTTENLVFGAVIINGNTTINMGNNSSTVIDDTVTFGQYAVFFPTLTAFLNGNLTIYQGTGEAAIQIGRAVVIGGNLYASMGEADNNFTVDSTPGFVVFGNATVIAGNGNNNIGLVATVAGNITVIVGNSDPGVGNFTTVRVSPGGRLTYQGGNGPDFLILDALIPGQTWLVNAIFGSNDDTVQLIGTGILNGNIDAGFAATSNTFVQAGWTLNPNLVLANFF